MILNMPFLRQALPQGTIYYANSDITHNEPFLLDQFTMLTSDACEVAIDSRAVKAGDIFLALQGERVDGHSFLAHAIERGAKALIIDKEKRHFLESLRPEQLRTVMVVTVRDTLQSLIDMAKYWRQRFTIPVVGITGSIGKTTTKEMVRSIVKAAGISTLVSYKNENTDIGLCLNILRMRPEHKAAIFELGINAPGEMSVLSEILQPTHGLITGIAHSHIKFLSSLREVADEKKKIFKLFAPHNIGMVWGDQPLLANAYYTHPVVKFGIKTKNQVQARKIKAHHTQDGEYRTQFLLKVYDQKGMVSLKANHPGWVYNALAAATIAHYLEVPFAHIIEGLESFSPVEGRCEFKKLSNGKGVLINDSYNANPESMRAAIKVCHDIKVTGNKIAVLGDMLELGEKEAFWHRQMGRVLTRALSIQTLILVGHLAHEIYKTAPFTMKVIKVDTWHGALTELSNVLEKDDSLVLVKGSFGVGLKNVVAAFAE